MGATVATVAYLGLEARAVEVQVQLSSGLRAFIIVGLPDKAVAESRDGLTSVHVNRTLKSLETDGLIERVTPRSITIGDWKKLAAAGDFDSNYLHLHENEPALV